MSGGAMTMTTQAITEPSTRAEIAEALDANTRRLMAERAYLSLRWDTRAERRNLLADIDDALDDWLAAEA